MILLVFLLTNFVLLNAQPGPLNWNLGPATKLNNFLPHGDYYPDGHLSVIKTNNQYYGFWSEFENFRTVSNSPDLTTHAGKLNPTTGIFGGRKDDNGNGYSASSWSDGGAWLIGVNRLNDGRLVGFFHAESHWYPRNGDYTAYKTIGVAYSSNEGVSWGTGEAYQIITPPYNKTTFRRWSGNGDGVVVYNPFNGKYMCYYTASRFVGNYPGNAEINSPQICLAATDDPNGWYVNWRKYDGSGYNQPGRGGIDTPLKNLDKRPGANPSVHYNTYLQRWVMVWQIWSPKHIYISSSFDGVTWADPQPLITDTDGLSYANIIGDTHDIGGQKVRIYYGRDYDSQGRRDIMYRDLTFY